MVICGFSYPAEKRLWNSGIWCNCINEAPTYAQEQLADAERRETVNHPSYYTTGGIEAIDAIETWGLGFNLGNVVKYIARAGRKTADSLQDLRKAAWYLDREIKRRERE